MFARIVKLGLVVICLIASFYERTSLGMADFYEDISLGLYLSPYLVNLGRPVSELVQLVFHVYS